MLDLTERIPKLGRCDTLIITGGGASLRDHIDEIYETLSDNRKAVLFEINGYLSAIDLDRMDTVSNAKVVFCQDFGIRGPYNPIDNRVIAALTGKCKAYLVAFDTPYNRKLARNYGIHKRMIYAKPSAARDVDQWDTLKKEKNTVLRRGGTFASAMSAIPTNIKRIVGYGFDAIKSGDNRHVMDEPHDYNGLVTILKPIVKKLHIELI